MSYCDFNLTLFNQFTSGKTKIIPALSDDWELIDKTNIIRDGVALQSNKLDQTVYDIPMRRYLKFCKMENISVVGNKLQGSFAIGQDRSVYNKSDFDKWTKKYNSRTETIISVKDAKAGHIYRTVCGLSVIYLGAKYTAKFKNEDSFADKEYTKISKTHFIHTRVDFEDDNPKYGIQRKGSYQFIRDMGYALDQDEIDNVLKHHYYSDMNYVYFGDKSIKNPEYGYIEVEPFSYRSKSYKDDVPDYHVRYRILFSLYKGRYYKCKYKNTSYENGLAYDENLHLVESFPSYSYYSYHRNSSTKYEIVPEKLMRIGVVNKDKV